MKKESRLTFRKFHTIDEFVATRAGKIVMAIVIVGTVLLVGHLNYIWN